MADRGCMSDSVKIESVNTNFLNQYSATSEELIAEAMEQFGLLDDNTLINEVSARDHLKRLLEKKKHYHGILPRKASFITKLGSLLVQRNIINTMQLREALNYQKQTPIKIGEILVKLGFVREEEIADIIEEQRKIRNVLEKMSEVKTIDVDITYNEPLFERSIMRRDQKPYVTTETIDTSDISDAIIEALTNFFDNEKKNSVGWLSEIVGIKVSLEFPEKNPSEDKEQPQS